MEERNHRLGDVVSELFISIKINREQVVGVDIFEIPIRKPNVVAVSDAAIVKLLSGAPDALKNDKAIGSKLLWSINPSEKNSIRDVRLRREN